ncbi:putative 3-hydroxyisobutyryl-CoA hydrolase 3 [Zancudomyces culisetae]|uniref:3-hydroxyisobutyryl-CoA hydrolase n=1 Tax=Zancudomyces culisetae TaxID=1213189 RepID=A0A1R1PIY5_ZANCU|nr:putative 3-hydroxyisobutyryl-CoA hydrolase 3 [Zancudomyces culisetae]OMH81690.1 putative 3-hydroxyisobutyryl-CoA hydrolase 3 [Zancudomyces culisetae]|eukprot:OMH80941.1 putative 3-hydroxyisobutyryl-CoA hydrolase 3 [Zancudomyces culisetae]
MPETLIGLFPDVGASFFLSRLDGELGTYMGLMGHRLRARDIFYAGIGTHYVKSKKLPELEERLARIQHKDYNAINKVLEEFVEPDVNASQGKIYTYSMLKYTDVINRCFCFSTIEDIMGALKRETDMQEWAVVTIEEMKKRSPTSLKVTLELLRRGRNMSLKACLEMESQVACRIIEGSDFREGVTELLVTKKRQPKWNPSRLDVVDLDKIQKKFFGPPDTDYSLAFPSDIDYILSPHRGFALPTDLEIDYVCTRVLNYNYPGNIAKARLVSILVEKYGGKDGVIQK